MKTKWDGKSVLVGLLLGGLVAASVGAGLRDTVPGGRFTITANEGHVFVLDTTTGKVWEKFTPVGSGATSGEFNTQKAFP